MNDDTMDDLPTVTIAPKRYLVTASDGYYPNSGTGDWIYHGPDLEEAHRVFTKASIERDTACIIDLFTGQELA